MIHNGLDFVFLPWKSPLWNLSSFEFHFDGTRLSSLYKDKIGLNKKKLYKFAWAKDNWIFLKLHMSENRTSEIRVFDHRNAFYEKFLTIFLMCGCCCLPWEHAQWRPPTVVMVEAARRRRPPHQPMPRAPARRSCRRHCAASSAVQRDGWGRWLSAVGCPAVLAAGSQLLLEASYAGLIHQVGLWKSVLVLAEES